MKTVIISALFALICSALIFLTGYHIGEDKHYQQGRGLGFIEGYVSAEEDIDRLQAIIDDLTQDGFLPWYSVEELEWWLADNPISEREWVKQVYDCDNFARDLAREAAKENRFIGLMQGDGHISNFAIVNNYLYSIEPQTDVVGYWSKIDKVYQVSE